MQKKRILAGALGCMLACIQPVGYYAAAEIPQVQDINQNENPSMKQTQENLNLDLDKGDQNELVP